MGRAIVASCAVHLAVGVGLLLGSWAPAAVPMSAPLIIDITVVEPSALETELPLKAIHAESKKTVQRARVQPLSSDSKVDVAFQSKERRLEGKKLVQEAQTKSAKLSRALDPVNISQPAPINAQADLVPVDGGSDVVQKARVSYQTMIATLLARAKRYPDSAARNRITGSGVIRLKIIPEGNVVSIELAKSTQSEILDEELHRMVERAGPFPAFPLGMERSQLTLLVPVSFRLDS